jgi:HlyD family secretion protein
MQLFPKSWAAALSRCKSWLVTDVLARIVRADRTVSNAPSKFLVPVVWRRSEPKDPTLPAILEFQWPSTAIINTPLPRSARGVVWIISSMVVALIAAAAVLPIEQVVTARGIVVSQSATILVQPLETAIVRSIDVREGQQVQAGQVLARLDSTFAAADLTTLAAQVVGLEAETARLQAEANGNPFDYSGHDASWELQAAIHSHRMAEYDSKIDSYRHKLGELDAVISRSESDAVGYRERLGVAQSVEKMWGQLAAQNSGSRLTQLQAVDNRAEMARALANAEQTGAGTKLDKAALESERNAFIQGWRADVSQKLSEANSKLSDAGGLLNKAKLRRQLVELHSERDAIVQSVAKVSVGSVLQSGQHFITLVPVDAPLEVEANIAGRDNGFIHISDPVAIKFDTFPYSQYGMAEGIVRIVSPDSFTAQEEARNPTSAVPQLSNSAEPFYRARITVDRLALHDVPAGFRVTPGMPVTTDIKVGKRTVLKYLLGMVLPVAHEAMREPGRY